MARMLHAYATRTARDSAWRSKSISIYEEPSLGDLLFDPMLHQLMASDGVSMAELLRRIADAKQALAR